jgi:hypothetical protein
MFPPRVSLTSRRRIYDAAWESRRYVVQIHFCCTLLQIKDHILSWKRLSNTYIFIFRILYLTEWKCTMKEDINYFGIRIHEGLWGLRARTSVSNKLSHWRKDESWIILHKHIHIFNLNLNNVPYSRTYNLLSWRLRNVNMSNLRQIGKRNKTHEGLLGEMRCSLWIPDIKFENFVTVFRTSHRYTVTPAQCLLVAFTNKDTSNVKLTTHLLLSLWLKNAEFHFSTFYSSSLFGAEDLRGFMDI